MVNIRRYKPIAPGDWSSLFGSPQLLDGEDAAAYDSLSAQVRAAVKPLDVIEEMFVTDVVSLTWEVQRWRRLKSRLLRARGIEELEAFLGREPDYDNYREEFEFSLSEILEQYVSEEEAEKLAHQCARHQQSAVDEVNQLLADGSQSIDQILDRAQADQAKQIARDYTRNDSSAVKKVNELLASHGVTLDNLLVDGLIANQQECLTMVERIDRLITIAESRRNESLREIDWHRTTLGKALRQTIENIEESGLRVIEEAPAKGKAAR
jgi:hypothetical protein